MNIDPTALDALTPELKAALEHRMLKPKTDTMTAAEQSALASARTLRPRQVRAKMRRQIRQQLVRMAKPVRLLMMPPTPRYIGPKVRVGYDAEWVTLPDGPDRWRNEVLCITAVVDCGGKRSRYIYYPKGPLRGDRPTLSGFFQRALRLALKEGVVPSMPDELLIFGHFMRGDLASFNDFWAYKREFRGLGKTLVSGRHGLVLDLGDDIVRATDNSVSPGEPRAPDETGGDSLSRPHQACFRGTDGKRFLVRVRFLDTIKLTPGGRGLAYAGEMVGISKLDLHEDLGIPHAPAVERPECIGLGLPPRYGKDRMDLVMRDFPEETRKYAFQDAEIALGYGLWMERTAIEEFKLQRLPSTLAGISAAVVRDLSGGKKALAALVGRTTETESRFNEKARAYRTFTRDVPTPGLTIFYQFATDAYHGGRNECFYHGPTPVGFWYDYDLPGAYTTALAALRPVDYENIRQEFDPDAYGINDMGIAWIEFEFPPGTRYPSLPVRGERGALIFPMRGTKADRVFVTSPEIFLARSMGATVTIIQGYKAPWLSDVRIFEEFTRLVQTKRKEFPKATHSALNELWKEVGNSAYGLLAQGLKEKNVFDPQSMKSKKIEHSPLTEPLLAASATGYIRAVLGEIMWKLPASGTVITATTDGLLTDVPLDQIDLSGPLCQSFADIRERLFGRREVLDPTPKHGARQLASIAVRTTFTIKAADGFEIVCAKGSVKPPTRASPAPQNRHMLKLYLRQFPGMKIAHEQLISAREQLTRESDLFGVKRERSLNLRYDFKRKPMDPKMMPMGRHTERIAWDTKPWDTVAEADFARMRIDGWSRARARLLKDMTDYRDWESFYEASWAVHEACAAVGVKTIQVRDDNAGGILKRVFLQAGRLGAWGVAFEQRGLVAVAAFLTEAGFPTSKEDITYAARRNVPLLEHCVPWVPETVVLLRVILMKFPKFEFERAFRPIDCGSLAKFGLSPSSASSASSA